MRGDYLPFSAVVPPPPDWALTARVISGCLGILSGGA
jgi:hypothetical protein